MSADDMLRRLPAGVTRQQLIQVCDVLGLDADTVGELRLEAQGVWAELWDADQRRTVTVYLGVIRP